MEEKPTCPSCNSTNLVPQVMMDLEGRDEKVFSCKDCHWWG